MRQFYDESRVYRITGQQGGTEYREFSGQMLRPQPVESVGGVELGAHEPVFDITVSAAKRAPSAASPRTRRRRSATSWDSLLRPTPTLHWRVWT